MSRPRAWTPVLILASIYLGLLVWNGVSWPDPVVDFGRELYVPWQLTQHRVLYRDLAYFGGALPPYLNALWFRLFGASVRTLLLANAAITALLTYLIYQVFRSIGSRTSAILSSAAFLCLFAFNQLVPVGNYSFLFPYSHGATLGVLFFFALALALACAARGRTYWNGALTGILFGCLFLTKAEFFLAGFGMTVAFWAAEKRRAPRARQGSRRTAAAALFVITAVLPAAMVLAYLAAHSSRGLAWQGLLGEWYYLAATPVRHNSFYLINLGLAGWKSSVQIVILASAALTALFSLAAAAARLTRNRRMHSALWPYGLIAGLLAIAGGCLDLAVWEKLWRALPLFLLLLAFGLAVQIWRNAEAKERPELLDVRFALAVGSLLMLGKIILFARTFHYGFALAVPGTLLAVASLVDWLPVDMEHRGWNARVFRSVSVGMLMAACVAHVRTSHAYKAERLWTVGGGADAFHAGDKGRWVEMAREWMESRTGPQETLAVLPEGVMLNFLTRRPTPSRYLSWVPADVDMFGEARMTQDLIASRPDFLILINRDVPEYGKRGFGIDYALKVRSWLEQNYVLEKSLGAPPFENEYFGIQIYKKRTIASQTRLGAQ